MYLMCNRTDHRQDECPKSRNHLLNKEFNQEFDIIQLTYSCRAIGEHCCCCLTDCRFVAGVVTGQYFRPNRWRVIVRSLEEGEFVKRQFEAFLPFHFSEE
jgi:hypothetical protein